MEFNRLRRRSTMRRPLQADIPELRDMIENQGKSYSDCAKHYGCSASTITKRCAEWGIVTIKERNAKFSRDEEQWIVELIKDGLSVAEVADKFDEPQKSIRAVLQRHGVSMRDIKYEMFANVAPKNALGELIAEGLEAAHIVTSNGRPVAVILPYNDQTKEMVK